MKSIHLFNVAPALPPELDFLEKLALNLWWSWNFDAIELFRRIDPKLWKMTGHNPLRFFSHVPQKRFESLTGDHAFMTHLATVKERFEEDLLAERDGRGLEPPASACIAYFSLEYGIHESVRLYSGGLGCLAGDHLKAASDMNLPLVAVGLLYKQGYFQQYLNEDGWQQEAYPENEIQHLPVRRAVHAGGKTVVVSLPLPHGLLRAIAWRVDVGRVPLYLLDTNIPENPPEFRQISARLYGGDRETRLRQELLLGLGGFRLLVALGYDPPVCHMNEGHAAFVALGRLAHMVQEKAIDVDTALEILRRTTVFTTHTPVPAGNETFELPLVKAHLEALSKELPIEPEKVLAWGVTPGTADPKEMSMTVMALRNARFSNGVSRLHGWVARRMWAHLWPTHPEDEIPIAHITNGVHVPSWIAQDNAALYDRYIGPEWRVKHHDEDTLARVADIPDEDLWHANELARSRLVRTARELGERQLSMRNAPRAQIAQIKSVLNSDTLTIGFARRFAAYKRATLLLTDTKRLEALLTSEETPIQIVFAGKAHPADNEGKEMIRRIVEFARQPHVRQRVIFLEDYDIRIARDMIQGVDVWLNTPRRPQEASGTSGMKAAVNGALHVSVLDGWWAEGYSPDCGWAIGHGEEYDNSEYQDTVAARALYNLLENEVVPCFYDRAESGIPLRWIAMMKASIRMALSYFNSFRMLSQYHTLFYEPALAEYRELTAEDGGRAKRLVAQHGNLRSLWKDVRVGLPSTDRDISALHVGDTFHVRAVVELGTLKPDDVDVEVYYGPINAENEIGGGHVESMALAADGASGKYRFEGRVQCRTTGRYGLTVRVSPREPHWKHVLPGLMTWADGA
ncbi:MAG: alpha-glucan family phosphorylase [Kiritimatiellae bacterium]|nr:alpha-glucan family phosphorylase [Kiritimatiellia bacterium]